MHHDSVVEVPPHSLRQHHALKVLSLPDHICDTVLVRDAGDGLLDDRASIELAGGKVGRRPDDLDAPLMSPVIRPRALKCGKETVVNVDHVLPVTIAEVCTEDLHSAIEAISMSVCDSGGRYRY